MELFYLPSAPADLAPSSPIEIDGAEFHHLARVLRKRAGEHITVTDGRGQRLEVEIREVGKHSMEGVVLERSVLEPPSTSVTVAMSLLKAPARFDFFLEKAAELGVSGVIPMITRRTVSQPSRERMGARMERWRSIMLSASRQCGRFHLPELHEPLAFGEAVRLDGYDLRLIPYEASAEPPEADFAGKKVLFLIGPEGGFSPEEVDEARSAGLQEISFGRTILRAESAGVFAAALVRARLLDGPPGRWL
ncbi:16S rRNA (uracil(1498)-N(3))-methyltransferase [Chlorobium sp. N1]|uniref:16S rRNA (uracil(1498)-N(3))-methyltransferase n=1 Tax=Chlorobium sp. N1 TaxID=2491138 RepID=UPI001040A100|nr:16S rRNA (uracil(1498)-N(3))-methyltransferase [Chlorobium sp. N1]TCD47807.1 16S rRNA (uracil(1498)-N(3))-methyltransferase [Chlorobium sp. N1]